MVLGEEVESSLMQVEEVGNNCILLVACTKGESLVKISIVSTSESLKQYKQLGAWLKAYI